LTSTIDATVAAQSKTVVYRVTRKSRGDCLQQASLEQIDEIRAVATLMFSLL
jgi:hypothetical protein